MRTLLHGVAEARDAIQPKEFGGIAHEAQTLLDAVALGLVELARRHGIDLDDGMNKALAEIDERSAP